MASLLQTSGGGCQTSGNSQKYVEENIFWTLVFFNEYFFEVICLKESRKYSFVGNEIRMIVKVATQKHKKYSFYNWNQYSSRSKKDYDILIPFTCKHEFFAII